MICKLIDASEELHPDIWRVHFVFQDVLDAKPLTGKAMGISGGHITFMDREAYHGKYKEIAMVQTERAGGFQKRIVLGLGHSTDFSLERLRGATAALAKELGSRRIGRFVIAMEGLDLTPEDIREMALMIILSDYSFDKYKASKQNGLEEVYFELADSKDEAYSAAMEEGVHLGNATVLARNLTNEPANVLTPETLARRVLKVGKVAGFEVEVFKRKDIEKLGMHAFLEVAKGSHQSPRLIVMRYDGNPDSHLRIGLIGKGLTYDTGGLSLKTTKGMITMRSDMGGAAAVIGTLMAVARMQLRINVTAVIAACENAISAEAYRPGDIIDSMAGKKIYIENTDAEGRLTLIDALTYIIAHEKVDYVVDIATLTASAVRTLGNAGTVTLSNDDDFYQIFAAAADSYGENMWRMPMYEAYKEQLKSPYADYTNAPGIPGAITAGMFLQEFVGDKPWIHLDIAGSSWSEKTKGHLAKGATGAGVRSLYGLVKAMEAIVK